MQWQIAVLAAEIPCQWMFAAKSASDCECDGVVHSVPDNPVKLLFMCFLVHWFFSGTFKESNGKGGIRICLPGHCLSERQPYGDTNATSSPWTSLKDDQFCVRQLLASTCHCQHLASRRHRTVIPVATQMSLPPVCLPPVLSGPVLRDTARLYISDTPLLCAMGFWYPHHPKGSYSDTCAIPHENKANGCDTPSAILSRKHIARHGGVSRTGPLSRGPVKCAQFSGPT